MKKRKGGSTFIIILFTFVFMVFVMTILLVYANNNRLNAVRQRERIEAYYLVLSGIEVGKNVVYQDRDALGTTILTMYNSDPTLNALEDNITDYMGLDPDNGYEVLISVKPINKDGSAYTRGEAVWVEIYVEATVPDFSSSDTPVTQAGSIRILASSPNIISRHYEMPA